MESTSSQSFGDSWREAITSVVLSSFPERVDVDNSQVIVSTDGKTAYRVILTSATKFYDDYREYNVYFVETLQRDDYGDEDTTYLLKGLQLVCRFRSAFLEPSSDFLGETIAFTHLERLPIVAGKLLKELNLLHRDAQEAGLERPGMWARWVTIDHLKAMADAYRPCESKLRGIIPKVIAAKGQISVLEPLAKEMADSLITMETAVRPENTLLLREMAAQLNEIVKSKIRQSLRVLPSCLPDRTFWITEELSYERDPSSWISTSIRVPWPGEVVRRSTPPTDLARSCMLIRPSPP